MTSFIRSIGITGSTLIQISVPSSFAVVVRTCIVIGLYCLKQHYDWPVELLKVKGGIMGLGKCLTQENEDGCYGNVNASRNEGKERVKITERSGITQWRSWNRLPIWMSAHEVNLKSLKHICFSLACIIFFCVSIFSYTIFLFLFVITHSLLWY